MNGTYGVRLDGAQDIAMTRNFTAMTRKGKEIAPHCADFSRNLHTGDPRKELGQRVAGSHSPYRNDNKYGVIN